MTAAELRRVEVLLSAADLACLAAGGTVQVVGVNPQGGRDESSQSLRVVDVVITATDYL